MSLAIKSVRGFSPLLQRAVSQEFVTPTVARAAGLAPTALSTQRVFQAMRMVVPHREMSFRAAFPWQLPSTTAMASSREIFRRGMATKIDSPLKGDAFFNREREVEALTKMLNDEPQLSLISGPVNSGKTALILHLLANVGNKRPILYLNLREQSFSSVHAFQSALEGELSGWLKKIQEIAKQFNVKMGAFDFSFEASLRDHRTDPLARLNSLFHMMSDRLPAWTLLHGAQTPILFIDEANEMNMLLKDPQGHEALTNLFKWFVAHTKEKRHFHVILGASDSFFHLWVEKYIGASRFTSIVIGDLTKQEAEKFWMSRAVARLKLSEDRALRLFEDAYQVCGGNMFLLKKYVSEYDQSNGQLRPLGFSLVGAENAKLTNAFFRNGNGSPSSHVENGNPVWTREQLMTMIKKLTESKSGFLVYKDLCAEMGQNVVDAFIAYNLLHLRPTNKFSYEIPDAPEDQAIVTAETASSRFAMQRMLKEDKPSKI